VSYASRFALFLLTVLSVWTLFHLYVFSRAFSIAAVTGAIPPLYRWLLFAILWSSYPLGRVLVKTADGAVARTVEVLASLWMGALFLCFSTLLIADVATGFGKLLPSITAHARSAALAAGGLLALFATVQALRGPRIVQYEVQLPNLRPEHDGLKAVQLSDLHLGSLLGERWLTKRVDEVKALQPDVIFVTGDLIDIATGPVEPLVPVLARLTAPRGVYGVTGNHEFYAGIAPSLAIYEAAGIRTLRDESLEILPGLHLAGVDDMTARKQLGLDGQPVEKALRAVPRDAACIYLSHSPMQMRKAALLGASLMLSGHTHGGQIWPFTYLAALAYPNQGGRYEIDGMTLLVSRGTGTWGPPMRLFRRSEIVLITLRSPQKSG
jgi:predicted MPP superfamily phosphohydrolase